MDANSSVGGIALDCSESEIVMHSGEQSTNEISQQANEPKEVGEHIGETSDQSHREEKLNSCPEHEANPPVEASENDKLQQNVGESEAKQTRRPVTITHKLIMTNQPDSSTSPPEAAATPTTVFSNGKIGPDHEILKFNLNQSRPFYRFELNKTIWEVPHRYSEIKPVGAGSYGQVSSANDNVKQFKVAIKKLARPFQSSIHSKRTYRELTLLAHMRHENVIGLLDVFSPCKSFLEFNDVYLVTHLMGADLGGIIKTQKLSDDHIQFLIYQILRGLKYIHSAGIIHRDLKPSNIAVNEDCELKLLDFGLARHAEVEMTGYVATRWYRAPEIMLNWMRYNKTVDIWSVGCIMAEMLTSRTLFPGKDHIDQLLRIMTLCGTPDHEFMKKITSEEARNYVRTLPVMKRKNFNEIFGGANPLAIDLLDQMLKLDSDLRPTAEQALAHPYLAQYSDVNDEPTASSLYDESFEDQERTIDDWRRLVWREIVNFKLTNPD